ncbi:MAG: peptidoglycan-binding protein [Actinobacteria bacterium]|nr:peptidoglycan-binding protein [Actinomycetota bacterium]
MQVIRRDSAGPEVEDVQRRLADLALDIGSDDRGVFDAGTEAAVRAFQQGRGLVADGVVGPDTWRILVEAGYDLGDRTLYARHPMLRGDDVRELQSRLNHLGFDAGNMDGIYGPDTERAVRDFQLNVGLPVDGIAGSDTLSALRRLHRQHQSAPAVAVKEREGLRRGRQGSLVGVRLLVDPAHGPSDPGVVGPDGTPEHEIAWQLANRVVGRLIALGGQAILSRGPSNTPSPSRRARLANDEGVELVVSLHLNGLASPNACGAAAYYFGTAQSRSEAGCELAERAVDALAAATGAPNCRAHPAASTILRETRAPAVVVEPGFLTHPDEGLRLADSEYQDTIADALIGALDAYVRGG